MSNKAAALLGGALIVIFLCGASLAGDAGFIADPDHRKVWDQIATYGLLVWSVGAVAAFLGDKG